MSRAHLSLAALALALSACSGAGKKPVGVTVVPKVDAGTDAGPEDAGTDAGIDAGPPDAGPPDAGLGGPCTTTHDCFGGQVCIAGTCGAAGSVGQGGACSASRDCASGLFCAPVGQCLTAGPGDAGADCTLDADCQAGLRCLYSGLAATCAPGGTTDLGDSCTGQGDCLPGLFCSAASPRVCEPYATAFPPNPGVQCQDDDGGLRVYFEVPRAGAPPKDFFRLPYPNDVRVTNGQLDIADFPTPGLSVLDLDLVALYRDALTADFAGFSATAPVLFRFSKDIDINSLNTAIQFIDLSVASDSRPFFYYYSYIINGNHYNCPNRLAIGPSEASPLRAGHTYAVVLKAGIKDLGNRGVVADADLVAVLGTSRPASDAALQHAWDVYQPLRTYLADTTHNLRASDIVGASVFTVADVRAPMDGLAQAVAAEPIATITQLGVCEDGGSGSACDDLPGHACGTPSPDFYELHGRMALPIYQQGTEPYATPTEGGGITSGDGGLAIKQRNEDVCIALSVPRSAMPDAGWPLVITSHGTGGGSTDFISSGIATAMATASTPAVVLGFDAVEHANRRGSSTTPPERLVFNLTNPPAARDNFLQGAADILGVAKLVGGRVTPTGLSELAFDPDRAAFFGHSQGSTSGELALPWLDAAKVAVLSGAGAHLTQSLLNKTSPFPIKGKLALALGEDVNQLDAEHPFMVLIQNYFDRSDPLNYNGLVFREPLPGHPPHSVLMTWGTFDTYTPQQTLKANADSLGTPVVGTVLEGGYQNPVSRPVSGNFSPGGVQVTAAMVQYATPSNTDGHFVAFDVASAQGDWEAFLNSGWAGVPTLP